MRDFNPNFSAARTRERSGRLAAAKPARKSNFGGPLFGACALVGIAAWDMAPQLQSAATVATSTPEERAQREASVHYSGCNAARAAGAAPIYAGQPGYREEMDGDGDGIACEPHRGF